MKQAFYTLILLAAPFALKAQSIAIIGTDSTKAETVTRTDQTGKTDTIRGINGKFPIVLHIGNNTITLHHKGKQTQIIIPYEPPQKEINYYCF